jgi:hypothetical protein
VPVDFSGMIKRCAIWLGSAAAMAAIFGYSFFINWH